MKRSSLVGLCIVAVFASSALLATSSQAARPVAKGPIETTGESGPFELSSSALPPTHCDRDFWLDPWYHVNESEDMAEFTSCEAGGKRCGNVALGTIKTSLLINRLGWINKEKPEVGVEYAPKMGSSVMEFECEGSKVNVTGAVIGSITPLNKMSTVSTVTLSGAGFKQVPSKFEGGPTRVLTESIEKVGESEALLTDTVTFTNKEQVVKKGKKVSKLADPAEIGTVQSGTPELGRCRASKKKGNYKDPNCTEREKSKDPDGRWEWFPVPS